MRRPLALLAAVLALAAAPAGAREPLDFDLTRLGPPGADVWLVQAGCLTPSGNACSAQQQADAAVMAGNARARFARLATDLALAFTSSLLEPASTTGHSGFDVALETAYTGVHHGTVGADTTSFPAATYGSPDLWPTRTLKPTELLLPSVHARKALPFSIELGGRLTWLSQSSYFAAQLEGKWAIVEGYAVIPDVAVRAAHTRLFGNRDLDLGATELDLMVSKRFGMNAVISLTPYLAGRLTLLRASSPVLQFRPDAATPATPAELALSSAAFPALSSTLYRTTAGVRMTSFAVAMAVELTYFGGGAQGKKSPGAGDYPAYYTPGSLGGAFRFGFEF